MQFSIPRGKNKQTLEALVHCKELNCYCLRGKKAAALNILNPQHRPFGGETDACPGHCAVEEGNRIITDVSFLCLHTRE